MKKVITIAGSNSHKSINKALIAYASNLIEDVEIITIDLNNQYGRCIYHLISRT